ncbi:unnamed protein product [Mycena citricolor]|uniref:Retrovirus-related Pol polyprotein from transposon TNT 1-94-like beta-barrel domain-containing protein n=1 Tax=Mycena citricolor TaxID=2018698 RepID=A0AAD2JYQ8_9AGAR|nr:unnamed protein product [Mycena citricolor]
MTHCVHLLQNTRPHRAPIKVANGVVVYSELVGEIVLRPLIHGHARSRSVILSNVLYVPALSHNLISTTYLSVHHDYTVLMKENYILFKRNGEVYFVADISEQGQAFVRETGFPSAGSALVSTAGTLPIDLSLMHRRPGHHSDTKLVMDKELVTGVRLASARKPDPTGGSRSRHSRTIKGESTCLMSSDHIWTSVALCTAIQSGHGLSRMGQQSGLTAPLMSTQLPCYMKPTCPLHSGHWRCLHTSMCATCTPQLETPPGLPMSCGSRQSLMCLICVFGDALPMCMCKETREVLLGIMSRSVSL